jgi:DNA invertase Pin-like site-specific DNA recombinase
MNKEFVAYYRVSTTKQGISGLGMEAQKHSVGNYLRLNEGHLLAEYAEVESGKNNSRQELGKALAHCRAKKGILVIAKLDRLARNAAFLLNLRDSGVEFVAVDMPQADRFTVGIMALVAEREREMTSERTKAGLAAARRRGTRLGNPNPEGAQRAAREANSQRAREFRASLLPVVQRIQRSGVSSLRGIAECLNARGVRTPTGKEFAAQSVKNILIPSV